MLSFVRAAPRVMPLIVLAVLLALTTVLAVSHNGPRRYDDHAAIRVEPRSAAERERVLELAVDIWSERIGPGAIDVVVSPDGLAALRAMGVPLTVTLADIQAPVDAERARLEEATAAKPSNWFAEYRDFEAVSAYIETLASVRPDLVSVRELGTSVEGRPIRALRISGPGDGKPGVVFNGGQHAREWISVMVTTCVADRLIRGYDTDPRMRAAVDQLELFVVPVVNPDGYQYSWDKDRYWRKNRQGPHGVDLNRNFGYAWGGDGSSSREKSQIYRGPRAFSEPESRAMRDLFAAENIQAHIDFHSFSQLILHPYCHTKRPAPDRDRLAAIADSMASAIHATHGKVYKIQSGGDLYPASGTFSDWSYGAEGATSFVIELRPARGSGFVLPPREIVPTCEENLAAVLELTDRLIRQPTAP